MPLPVGTPCVAIGNPIHAESGNSMSADFPVVWICNVFSFWRFDLNFITVLHVDSAVGVTVRFTISPGAHHDEFGVALITGIFFLVTRSWVPHFFPPLVIKVLPLPFGLSIILQVISISFLGHISQFFRTDSMVPSKRISAPFGAFSQTSLFSS